MARLRCWGSRLGHRLGRRGAALLSLGFLDLIYGTNLIWPPAGPRSGAYLGLMFPVQVWGVAWVVVGFILLTCAWLKHDQAGYAAAVLIKLLSGFQGVVSWVAGAPRAYVAASIWLSFAVLVAVIARWPEPPRDR